MSRCPNRVVQFQKPRGVTGQWIRTGSGGPRWRGAGGYSGSVAVNKPLEVVGVVVNGNIESLHNDYVFTGDVPRAVSVHVDGIMEALVKIYDAHHVAKELTGK